METCQDSVIMPLVYEKETAYGFQYLQPPIQIPPMGRRHQHGHHHHHHHCHQRKFYESDSSSDYQLSWSDRSDIESEAEYPKMKKPFCQQISDEHSGTHSQCKRSHLCFKKVINVSRYLPEEITVNMCLDHADGPCVIVKGYHGELPINKTFVSRSFSRRYVLPRNADLSSVRVHMNENKGRLMIKAATKCDQNRSIDDNVNKNVIRNYPIGIIPASSHDQDHGILPRCCENVYTGRHVKLRL